MTEEHAIGLPPPKDAPAPVATPQMMRFARLINLLGFISPAANLGLLWVGPRARRWFGVSAGVVCTATVVYAHRTDSTVLLTVALHVHMLLVVLGVINPLWVAGVGDVWAEFGMLIGKVMSYPMFTIVYFLAVTPTALLMRAFGKDPLGVKKRGAATYWTPHEPPSKDKYERQF